MGCLGGPDYPHDPTDLGPLVPLPGGYAEVFEYLASVGIRGFEFFQSTQDASEFDPPRQPTAAEIRQYLDAAGLKAIGDAPVRASATSIPRPANLTAGRARRCSTFLQHARDGDDGLLGQPVEPRTTAGRRIQREPGHRRGLREPVRLRRRGRQHANRIGEILQSRGVKYFYHPEQDNYRFFADPAHPELDTVHRIQWVMENTDPALFGWQIDVLHNWSGRVRFLNATTHQPDISVWELAQAQNGGA